MRGHSAASYEESKQQDGYVSLEVSPCSRMDTAGTLERRGDSGSGEPANAHGESPATAEGIPALRQLISEGDQRQSDAAFFA